MKIIPHSLACRLTVPFLKIPFLLTDINQASKCTLKLKLHIATKGFFPNILTLHMSISTKSNTEISNEGTDSYTPENKW